MISHNSAVGKSHSDKKSIRALVDERISCRAYLDRTVPEEIVMQLIADAGRSPSGGNLQPWKIHVLAGDKKNALINAVKDKINAGLTEDNPDIAVYPEKVVTPYRERRYDCGMALYEALDIRREDKEKRQQQWIANYEFFGAPVGMIFTMDKEMDYAQYIDLGIYMESLMLLAQAMDLSTCPQLAWSVWADTIREVIGIGSNETIICGMSLGYGNAKHPVNNYRTSRCKPAEFANFYGFDKE